MPPTLTYPGVYIAEAPSSVHTITGVATSIGAFFGQASQGPLNTPIECLSYSDYTRTFGGPVAGACLAQSVQQFFANGGADCFVVRLANGAQPAQVQLNNFAGGGVLVLSANSAGLWGTGLSAAVDYNTPWPDSTFNLAITYVNPTTKAVANESFASLSLDPNSPRYAPTFVTQSSSYITAAPGPTTISGLTAGYSEARGAIVVAAGGWNAAVAGAWPAAGDQGSFQISVDGAAWTQVNLSKALLTATATDAATFTYLQNSINNALGAASGLAVTVGDPADVEGDVDYLRIISASTGGANPKSSVQIKPANSGDIAQKLMLGVNQGGVEVARYADLRPVPNGITFLPTLAPNLNGDIAGAFDQLGLAHVNDVTGATLNGISVTFAWPAGDPPFTAGATAGDTDGIRENLQFMANTINSNLPGYSATVAGYRLSIENENPPAQNWVDTFSVQGTTASADFRGGFVSNVQAYPFGGSGNGTFTKSGGGTTASWAAFGAAPTDGNPPTLTDYQGVEANRTGFYALEFSGPLQPDGHSRRRHYRRERMGRHPLFRGRLLPEPARLSASRCAGGLDQERPAQCRPLRRAEVPPAHRRPGHQCRSFLPPRTVQQRWNAALRRPVGHGSRGLRRNRFVPRRLESSRGHQRRAHRRHGPRDRAH